MHPYPMMLQHIRNRTPNKGQVEQETRYIYTYYTYLKKRLCLFVWRAHNHFSIATLIYPAEKRKDIFSHQQNTLYNTISWDDPES